MTPDQIADCIDSVADVIEKSGLARYVYRNGSQHCTVGALLETTNSYNHSSFLHMSRWPEEVAAPLRFIASQLSGHEVLGITNAFDHVTKWNDDVERPQQEIIDKLREIAKTARKVGDGID